MLARRIKEFIEALSSIEEQLNEHDLKLLHAFQERYFARPAEDKVLVENTDKAPEQDRISKEADENSGVLNEEEILSEEELNWIQKRFAERWTEIADTSLDYTFNSSGLNTAWVSLAKDLAPELKKPYLLVLIPVLINNIDPNNLSRLHESPDARAVYLSNDNTWHRILALYNELRKPRSVFAILDKPGAVKPRALTLNELYRIRSKRGDELAFKTEKGEHYTSFWDYVMRESAPSWQQSGYCPTHLLPGLLEIIEKYFEADAKHGDLQQFHKLFKEFAAYLATCPVADVNHLYGIPIDVNGPNYFLVEILLDCMEGKDDLSEKLFAVVKWLCQYNSSLISKCEYLAPIYKELKAGSYFDLPFLRELVVQLNINDSSVVKPLQGELLRYLESVLTTGPEAEPEIRLQIIKQIKAMYALRWEKIIDKPSDYTRAKNIANLPWIRLAQYLAGAGYVDANYYRLLMPTLRQDIEPVTKEPITAYPLSHFILSTSGKELIYLPSCVGQHKANGTFYNCNNRSPIQLSSIEKARIKFSARKFYEYFLRVEEIVIDPPISKKTVDEVRKLVNGTLNPSGLSLLTTVSAEELEIADKSYEEFLGYLANLDADEKDRLFRQTILLGSHNKIFAEVMDLIQAPNYDDRECIALNGKYFAKLVMDYAPGTQFRKDIEQKAGIDNMRACSAKKIYSEYNDINNKEATKRALTILVSLMTHSFNYLIFTGIPLRFWDHINHVTDTGREIFKLLEAAIERGNFEHIRFIYATLIEQIVKPAIANKSTWIKIWARYEDTDSWLRSIEDGSMFESSVCFEPELLFTVLWSLAQEKPNIRPLIEEFLDEVQRTLAQTKNSYKKWVRVNIEFTKFLNQEGLTESEHEEILKPLRAAKNTTVTPKLVMQTSAEFLIHRLAMLGSRDAHCNQLGIFGSVPVPGQYKASYDNLRVMLDEKLCTSLNSSNDEKWSVNNIIAKLQIIVGKTTKKRESSSMQIYLNEMSQRITSEPSAKSEQFDATTWLTI